MNARVDKCLARLIKGLAFAAVWLGFLIGLQWSLFIAFVMGGFVGLGAGLYFWQPRPGRAMLERNGPLALPIGRFPAIGGGQAGFGDQADASGLASFGSGSCLNDDLRRLAMDARTLLQQIRASSQQIASQGFRNGVERVCAAAGSIVRDIENGSPVIMAVRKFVDYYLPATLRIVCLYGELSSRPQRAQSEQAILDRAEQILPEIEACFHHQLSHLQADRFADLDTELSVLETTMKLESHPFPIG